MITRRDLLRAAAAAPVALLRRDELLDSRLLAIERRVGGRLGVAMMDLADGRRLAHRPDARFPMCSTFKFPLAAAVLARVDRGDENLTRVIRYGKADLLEHAPITRPNAAKGGLTVEALCDAALTYSDNTAANLLLATIGGPTGFTRYLRTLGDPVTRLDRTEPHLNAATPDDARDTTTPAAMLSNLRTLLVETRALSAASRARLTGWLVANTTGAEKLRAGLPATWRVGDKTGMGVVGYFNFSAIQIRGSFTA
jgi:beta-lactamase class A